MLDHLSYSVALVVAPDQVDLATGLRGVELLTRSDGTHLLLFPDKWRIASVQRERPELVLTSLTGSAD